MIQRSPASVARKLGNFGAFDPQLQQQHITGLTHGSKNDREIWDEFHRNWNGLVEEADRLRKSYGKSFDYDYELIKPFGPSERIYSAKQRIHQAFFRQVVLSSYEYRCCITGLCLPQVLIASHIVPWAVEEEFRTDPSNGLCLSATFDKLFDSGLISFTNDLNMIASSKLLKSKDKHIQEQILSYHDKPIYKPKRFLPSHKFLDWHRVNIFVT
jgi:predicted restriction endonuclease